MRYYYCYIAHEHTSIAYLAAESVNDARMKASVLPMVAEMTDEPYLDMRARLSPALDNIKAAKDIIDIHNLSKGDKEMLVSVGLFDEADSTFHSNPCPPLARQIGIHCSVMAPILPSQRGQRLFHFNQGKTCGG